MFSSSPTSQRFEVWYPTPESYYLFKHLGQAEASSAVQREKQGVFGGTSFVLFKNLVLA